MGRFQSNGIFALLPLVCRRMPMLSLGRRKKQDTVKTRKAIAKPTTGPLFMSEPYVSSVLLTGDVRRIVQQPKFMDNHEWLASFSTPVGLT